MIRNLLIATFIATLLVSCASTRPVSSASSKPVAPKPIASKPATSKTVAGSKPGDSKKVDIKFLDQITVNNQVAAAKTEKEDASRPVTPVSSVEKEASGNAEDGVALKEKYGKLLEVDPEMIENTDLLKSIDYWYGTRYKMGGTSKSGVDCSAFVQAVYLSAFAMAIPRTAFEQFRVTNHISAVEMKSGDLVFFNTTGGVSHVGIYLGNNKFVHASSARGVTISDLFEPYYLKRFLGVGRIEKPLSSR